MSFRSPALNRLRLRQQFRAQGRVNIDLGRQKRHYSLLFLAATNRLRNKLLKLRLNSLMLFFSAR
jgi:hypothetical protein